MAFAAILRRVVRRTIVSIIQHEKLDSGARKLVIHTRVARFAERWVRPEILERLQRALLVRGGAIARFRLGRIMATPNALAHLSPEDILRGIQRHQAGDWGEVDEHGQQANDRALTAGGRLFSVYRSANGIKFWTITEADRSATTLLMPEDY